MTDPLPSIEARLEAGYYDRAFGAGKDIRWLLEEVKRLRREVHIVCVSGPETVTDGTDD
ncbi:MAG: hypothetical protein OEM93_10490 [Rhodospirillales bacterium]|nr:hypothetical protein [Rhodospirillales bacterium]